MRRDRSDLEDRSFPPYWTPLRQSLNWQRFWQMENPQKPYRSSCRLSPSFKHCWLGILNDFWRKKSNFEEWQCPTTYRSRRCDEGYKVAWGFLLSGMTLLKQKNRDWKLHICRPQETVVVRLLPSDLGHNLAIASWTITPRVQKRPDFPHITERDPVSPQTRTIKCLQTTPNICAKI